MLDNKKTKIAGRGLVTVGLVGAVFNVAKAMGWIHLTPEQQQAWVELAFQIAPMVGIAFAGLGFLGLGHKSEKQDVKLDALNEKANDIMSIGAEAANKVS